MASRDFALQQSLTLGYGAIGAVFLRYLIFNIRTKTLLSTEPAA